MIRARARDRRRPGGVGRALAALAAAAMLAGPLAASPAFAAEPEGDPPVLLVAEGEQSDGATGATGAAVGSVEGSASSPADGIPLAPEPPTAAPQSLAVPAPLAEPESPHPGPPTNAVEPLPGQSDLPAPSSRQKRVIENVHTDTVSAFVDDGRLALDSRADVDGELGKRFAASETLFHLGEPGRTTVQSNPAYGFLGAPGDEVWLAPQTQDHAVIWPGFSTEHPSLRAAAEGQWLSTRMLGATGPGRVEVYLLGDDGPERVFSSTEALPDWRIRVPQHTHMNWAFTAPGTYTVAFEMDAVIGGAAQSARNEYTFVVGELAAHTLATATTLEADAVATEPGEPVTFTARVDPAAVGAVQFRDAASNAVLGHAPLGADGAAAFRTGALPPGERRVVAEFVPTWSDDFAPSASAELAVAVGGEAIPRPGHDDATPATEAELAATPARTGVETTSPRVRAGGVLAAAVAAEELRGDWVSVWMHGAAAVWLGWAQVDLGGGLTADVPAGAAPGEYRLAVKRRDGSLVGWDRFTVTEPPGTGGGPETPGEPSTPTPAPVAPPQECLPAVTLDRGHVDAFAVSAANGTAVLQLLEDVTGHRVLREAETVLMRVPESAYAGIPGQPGGPAGYVLPLTQNPGLVWPGWDTNRTAASGYSSVAINVTGVSGPGQVYLSTRTPFGELRPVLTHGGYALPGTIHESTPAHTHAQWVFTQPGVYVLTAHAVATNPSTGAGLATASHDYVFQVGDVPLGDVFCGLSAHGAGASAMVDAAVTQAGLEAVAAEQAAAAERDRRSSRERDRADGRAAQGKAAAPASLGAGANPAVVWSIVGGGVLAIGGIAGATVWLLRRVDAEPGG